MNNKINFSIFKKEIFLTFFLLSFLAVIWFIFFGKAINNKIISSYENRQSISIKDRSGKNIYLKPNHLGYHSKYSNDIPSEFKELLIKKEDKYFYYHFGVNPISTLRAFYNLILGKDNLASSTITQQLTKILLENESERSMKNKLIETAYAINLELYSSKEDIIIMYINSVYLGNNIQGINQASRLYFDTTPNLLTKEQSMQLLATLSSPSANHPFSASNALTSNTLAKNIQVNIEEIKTAEVNEIIQKKEAFSNYIKNNTFFELDSLGIECQINCNLSIDKELSISSRDILKRNLLLMDKKSVTNGAIVIIKLPENELLSIIGSPQPEVPSYGYQINMAIKPRPIGSTVKPFIYLKGFEKQLRPYTIVDDKEYKYTIGTGFSFYPKNYDYQYRGRVNLHYALTNSLNVPSVKVLEYSGIDNFNHFLLEDLEFKPVQDIKNYQLGIALGELEMDLTTLSYYFTIFPNKGVLNPLKVYGNNNSFSASINTNFSQQKQIAEEKYIQLINKIISDRNTGIEQFGIKSNLNISQNNYAVKTGTSGEYHDSWTVGYTPDFLVGVWVGNSDNTPMKNISGQSGAGRIWNEIMNLLINSNYNKKTPLNFDLVKEYYDNGTIEYGLLDDDFEKSKCLLENDNIILNPHDGDVFLLEEDTQITLSARESVEWFVNNIFFDKASELNFKPMTYGRYEIKAIKENDDEETVIIHVEKEE